MKQHGSYIQSLLSDRDVTIVSKTLARALGVPKSIILRRIQFFMEYNSRDKKGKEATHYKYGQWWMYDTYPEWVEGIGFYSERTIRRNLVELEDLKLIMSSGDFNKMSMDRTKWYTINIEAFEKFIELWFEHDCPMFNGTKKTPEYKAFVAEWDEVKESFLTFDEFKKSLLEDDSHVSLKDDSHVSLKDSPHASLKDAPIPESTESTENYIASSGSPDDTRGNSRFGKASKFAGLSSNVEAVSPTNDDEASESEYTDESALPDFAILMMQTCRAKWKNVSKSMRNRIFNVGLKAWDDENSTYIDIAPISEQYDKDRVYAAWIREVIIPEMKKQTGGRIAKGKFLDRASDYLRFQKWSKSEYGKQFASRVKVIAPTSPVQVESSSEELVEFDG